MSNPLPTPPHEPLATSTAANYNKPVQGLDFLEPQPRPPLVDQLTPAPSEAPTGDNPTPTEGTQVYTFESTPNATTDPTTTETATTRNLVRLHSLKPSQLPAHVVLTDAQKDAPRLPELHEFCEQILREATQVIDQDIREAREKTFDNVGKLPRPKRSKPSKAFVENLAWKHEIQIAAPADSSTTPEPPGRIKKILRRTPVINPPATKIEHWFARSSTHFRDEVTWKEFEDYLCDDHSENERRYTEKISEAFQVCAWELGGKEIDRWRDVKLYGKF